LSALYVEGTATNLSAGDFILLVFGEDGSPSVIRTVAEVEADFTAGRTKLTLQPLPSPVAAFLIASNKLLAAVAAQDSKAGETPESLLAKRLAPFRAQFLLGSTAHLAALAKALLAAGGGEGIEKLFLDEVKANFAALSATSAPETTDPSKFIGPLLVEPIAQVANSLQLSRSPGKS